MTATPFVMLLSLLHERHPTLLAGVSITPACSRRQAWTCLQPSKTTRDYLGIDPDRLGTGPVRLPVGRLGEFEQGGRHATFRDIPTPERLAARAASRFGPGRGPGFETLATSTGRHAATDASLVIGHVIEVKAYLGRGRGATSCAAVPRYLTTLRRDSDSTVTLPTLLAAIGQAGRRAKVRTGGVTPEAFPTTAGTAALSPRCDAAARRRSRRRQGCIIPLRATTG